MCSQSGEPGLWAQARLGTMTHSGQLQARSQWPSEVDMVQQLGQQVVITAFELTYSLVLISLATQEIEVGSQNQTNFSPQSPYSHPHCALDLPDNKRPALLPVGYHAFIQNGDKIQEAESSTYYHHSHHHIQSSLSLEITCLPVQNALFKTRLSAFYSVSKDDEA